MPSKGGGPKTSAGKAASSRNAIKHGITSIQPVIEGIETEEDWLRFRDDIIASLDPEGALEQELARTVAYHLWRKRRVPFYENAILNQQVQETENDIATADAYLDGTLGEGKHTEPDAIHVIALQHTRTIPFAEEAARIMRYETHLHRLFLQTLHELEALQARRLGQPAHLARVDFTGPPT